MLQKIQEIIAQRTELGLPAEIINGTETSTRPVFNKDGKIVGVLINIFGHLTSLSQFYPARLEWQRICGAFRKHHVTLEVNLGTAFNYIQDIFMNRNIYPDLKPGEKNIWRKDLEILLHYNPSEEPLIFPLFPS